MKKPSLSICASLLLAGVASHSQAQVLVSANFDAGYTAGQTLTGQSGTDDVGFTGTFSGPYGSGADSATTLNVVSGGLTYRNGDVFIPGGANAIQVNTSSAGVQDLTSRSFNTVLGGNLYERIVLNLGTTGQPDSYVEAAIGGATNFFSTPNSVGLYNGQFSATVGTPNGGGNAQANGGAFTTGTNLLVAEFVYDATTGNYDRVNLFLNPSSTVQPTTPTATATSTGINSFSSFGLGIANITGTFELDSFAIGSTFGDVVTDVPEPSTWAFSILGVIGMVCYKFRCRFV